MRMSALDPATPSPPTPPVNTGPGGAVIPITAHTATRTRKGRMHMSSTPPPPPDRDRTELERIADHVQTAWFTPIDRTLANDEVALVFTRTIDFVDHTLKGAEAQGIISEDQRLKLAGLLDAAKQAPGLV